MGGDGSGLVSSGSSVFSFIEKEAKHSFFSFSDPYISAALDSANLYAQPQIAVKMFELFENVQSSQKGVFLKILKMFEKSYFSRARKKTNRHSSTRPKTWWPPEGPREPKKRKFEKI